MNTNLNDHVMPVTYSLLKSCNSKLYPAINLPFYECLLTKDKLYESVDNWFRR